jgi:spermidine/putrescine transport system substrate-binding protein
MSEAPRSEIGAAPEEQAQLLARAAQAGSMRRASAGYAQSVAMTRRAVMRNLALSGLAVTGVGALAACGTKGTAAGSVPSAEATGKAAATDYSDTEKALNFSNWGSYIDLNPQNKNDRPTLDGYTKATGVKVNYNEEITDNDEFYTKIDPLLKAGSDTGRDLIVMSDYMIPKLRHYNYIQELNLKNIPNHANILPAVLKDPIDAGRKYTMPWAYGYSVIAYNSNLTGPITTIKELFESPALKGKVVLFQEMQDTIAFALFALGKDPSKFTDDDFKAALAYVQKAKDAGQVRQFRGQDYINDFSQGNIAATMAYSGDVAQLNTPNLKTVIPTDGMLAWSDNMCIPNYARHKKNAELLMNYYYNPDVGAALDDYINYIPAVNGAITSLKTIDANAVSNQLIVPTAAMQAEAKGFMPLTVDQLDSYTQQFKKISG